MTWEPLCGAEPIEGEPHTVRQFARGLEATAELIATQVEVLQQLADPADWRAETADAFREQARDLADEIRQAEGRYRVVGGLVGTWADALEEARAAARRLRDEAQEQQRIVDANPEVGPEPPGPDAPPGAGPEMSAAGLAQNARREAALRAVDDLRSQLGRLVEDHEQDGRETGQRIRGALDDGLNDRWQDRLKAWVARHADVLRDIATWAGRIAAVVGLIALFISPLGWVAFAAALIALGASAALAATGDGSWTDAALNAIGVVTFGLGAFMTRGVSAAFRAGRGLLATRASASTRAAILNAGDGPAVSLLGRVPLVGDLVRGTVAASRAVRAPLAGGYRYLTVRFAPLEMPSVGHLFAYNGRRFAAIRREAYEWLDEVDDVAALGQQILHSGGISGLKYVPWVSLPGLVATGGGVFRDITQNLPPVRLP